MPINVSEAIDSDTAERITISRDTGSYVDGLWVANGAPLLVPALAGVQQPSTKQLEVLPRGEKATDAKLFISNKRINTTDAKSGLPADNIIFEGETYKCYAAADWGSYGHWTVVGVRQ